MGLQYNRGELIYLEGLTISGTKKLVWELADQNEIKDSVEECIVRKPHYLSALYL